MCTNKRLVELWFDRQNGRSCRQSRSICGETHDHNNLTAMGKQKSTTLIGMAIGKNMVNNT